MATKETLTSTRHLDGSPEGSLNGSRGKGESPTALPSKNGGNGRSAANGSAKRRPLNRESAVLDYQPLVRRLCRRFSGYGEPLDDLLQVGTIGLIKAIAKFDADRGNSFITYAVPVIVGEIKNYLRDNGWAVKMPRKLQSNRLAVQRAAGSLGHKLSRPPTVSELAEETDLSHEQVMDTFGVENYGRPLSLQTEYKHGDGSSDTYLIDRVGRWDPEFETSIDKIDLDNSFRCLGKREKTIIYLKFYGGLTQMEIAGRLNISQMHVSRLQRRALSKLRDAMDRARSDSTSRRQVHFGG